MVFLDALSLYRHFPLNNQDSQTFRITERKNHCQKLQVARHLPPGRLTKRNPGADLPKLNIPGLHPGYPCGQGALAAQLAERTAPSNGSSV